MFQVRFHGRGGRGVVTAAELMASAANRIQAAADRNIRRFDLAPVAADHSRLAVPVEDEDK